MVSRKRKRKMRRKTRRKRGGDLTDDQKKNLESAFKHVWRFESSKWVTNKLDENWLYYLNHYLSLNDWKKNDRIYFKMIDRLKSFEVLRDGSDGESNRHNPPQGDDIEFIWNNENLDGEINISQVPSKDVKDGNNFESFNIKKDELKKFIKEFTEPYIDKEIQEKKIEEEKERKKREAEKQKKEEEEKTCKRENFKSCDHKKYKNKALKLKNYLEKGEEKDFEDNDDDDEEKNVKTYVMFHLTGIEKPMEDNIIEKKEKDDFGYRKIKNDDTFASSGDLIGFKNECWLKNKHIDLNRKGERGKKNSGLYKKVPDVLLNDWKTDFQKHINNDFNLVSDFNDPISFDNINDIVKVELINVINKVKDELDICETKRDYNLMNDCSKGGGRKKRTKRKRKKRRRKKKSRKRRKRTRRRR